MTSQLWATRSCEKACLKDAQYSGQFFGFPFERFPTTVSTCSFPALQSLTSLYQFNSHCKEIHVSINFLYNKSLQQPHNTLQLPPDLSGSNNPSTNNLVKSSAHWCQPAAALTGFTRLQKSLLRSMRCTGWDFVHQREINWKYLLNKQAKRGHAYNWHMTLKYGMRLRQHLLTHIQRSAHSIPKADISTLCKRFKMEQEKTSSRGPSLPSPVGMGN